MLDSGNEVVDGITELDDVKDDNVALVDMIVVVDSKFNSSILSKTVVEILRLFVLKLTSGTIVVIRLDDVVSKLLLVCGIALNFVVDGITELLIKIHKYKIEIDKQIILKCNINILFGEFNWNKKAGKNRNIR